jgi:hypothetical protein
MPIFYPLDMLNCNLKNIYFTLLLLLPLKLMAQDTGIPLNSPSYDILNRISVQTGVHLDNATLPVSRQEVVQFIQNVRTSGVILSERDLKDITWLERDNNEFFPGDTLLKYNRRRIFRHFYPTKTHLIEYDSPDFSVRANPMFNFGIASERDNENVLFANQRGAEIRARIGKKVYVYTSFLETQARFNSFTTRWINENNAIPGNGLFKTYNSTVTDKINGYDFNNAVGYIAAPLTKQISFQLGHGRHFIGQGYRSMFVSDFSNNYFYAKLRTKVWKFTYENYYVDLSRPFSTLDPRNGEDKRFGVFHYLNFKATNNLKFGVFEAVSFKRNTGFELQYINPVILYRTIEGGFNSSDNVLLGADFSWNIAKRFQVYGQLLLDEFLFAALYNPKERGWWGNKSAKQIGLKYTNVAGIDHLDLQVEYNSARPYTYSHFDSLSNWTHFGQPLAHPLGANFKELVTILRYQPFPKWTFQARYLNIIKGEDGAAQNWGGNPNLTYNVRPNDYGNFIGQGDRSTISIIGIDVNWRLSHLLYWDFKVLMRQQNSTNDSRDLNSYIFGTGLRMNVWSKDSDF